MKKHLRFLLFSVSFLTVLGLSLTLSGCGHSQKTEVKNPNKTPLKQNSSGINNQKSTPYTPPQTKEEAVNDLEMSVTELENSSNEALSSVEENASNDQANIEVEESLGKTAQELEKLE